MLAPTSLSILTGLLIGTSYIPFPPWAALFCFVPLWASWLNAQSARQIFWTGWLAQFTLSLVGFNWVAYMAHLFGHLPMPLAILVLLLFASVANLFVPAAGLAWFYLTRQWAQLAPKSLRSLLLLGLLTAGAQALLPTVFPWHMGYVWFFSAWPIFHLAEWMGAWGLAVVTILMSSGFLFIWTRRRERSIYPALAKLLLVFGTLNVVGWIAGKRLPEPDSSAQVLMVQANIGNQEKVYAEHGWGFRDTILDRHLRLTLQGLSESQASRKKIDFVLWPETAFPDLVRVTPPYSRLQQRLASALQEAQVPLVTGAYMTDPVRRKTTNSMVVFNKNGELEPVSYAKMHLLIFGEYIPFESRFPKLRRFIPAGDFVPGLEPVNLSLPGLKIAPQICYESLFPRISWETVSLGADIMVNVTNDSWYGTWQEPYQHLYMTLARAVEFRRPLVRATNTGFSAVLHADGKVSHMSPLHKEWTQAAEVPFRRDQPPTFFQHFYWLMHLLVVSAILGILVDGKLRRSH